MSTSARPAREILRDVTKLAVEYYAATGKPLGITGEIAELEAAERLGLTLANARTAGYDATRAHNGTTERIQIKGRRVARAAPYRGRMPSIDLTKEFDNVVLVLFDEAFALPSSDRLTLLCEKFGALEARFVWRSGQFAGVRFADPEIVTAVPASIKSADSIVIRAAAFGRRGARIG